MRRIVRWDPLIENAQSISLIARKAGSHFACDGRAETLVGSD